MWVRLNGCTHWVRGCDGMGEWFVYNEKYCKFQKCTIKNPNRLSPLYVQVNDIFAELDENKKPLRVFKIKTLADLEMLAQRYTTEFAINNLD